MAIDFVLKEMRDMVIGDTITVNDTLEIRRVPGGWNYEYKAVTVVFIEDPDYPEYPEQLSETELSNILDNYKGETNEKE